jgi:hypothetical protein
MTVLLYANLMHSTPTTCVMWIINHMKIQKIASSPLQKVCSRTGEVFDKVQPYAQRLVHEVEFLKTQSTRYGECEQSSVFWEELWYWQT